MKKRPTRAPDPASAVRNAELRTAMAARRILAAAAAGRGEDFDPGAPLIPGPPQSGATPMPQANVVATAEAILAAGRKARGELERKK